MSRVNRNQWLLLLLVVLISHAALTIHSGTHLTLDQQSCELCTQQANFSHAVPPAISLSFEVGQEAPQVSGAAGAAPTAASVPYHQRAPPRNT
jgi:hypothetical protein